MKKNPFENGTRAYWDWEAEQFHKRFTHLVGLSCRAYNVLAGLNLDTMSKVEDAFDTGKLDPHRPEHPRNWGRKSYDELRRFLGRPEKPQSFTRSHVHFDRMLDLLLYADRYMADPLIVQGDCCCDVPAGDCPCPMCAATHFRSSLEKLGVNLNQ